MSKAAELSHPNEVVQNNLVQMVDMPTIDENFTRGLQVVGTIHVPFSSVNTSYTLILVILPSAWLLLELLRLTMLANVYWPLWL